MAFNDTKCIKLLSDFKRNYYSSKIEKNKDNLKGTWQTSNGTGIGISSTIEKVTYKGCKISDKKGTADICNEHFVYVGKRLAENIPDAGESPTAHIRPTSRRFILSKVEKALKKLV